MTILIIILSIILLFVVLLQIAKINEIASEIRGEEESEYRSSDASGKWLLIYGVVFLAACFWSAIYYTNYMMGYGPHTSASEHGSVIDSMFNLTLIFTGIVFVLTHAALFWFAYKYRSQPGRKALFMPHDNRLEIIWTAIPALVMTILVVKGLVAWNSIMADVSETDNYLEIEATGWQFAWNLRYPGADGKLGVKDFRLIEPGINELGQDWNDERNHDDFNSDELVLPKGKKIRIRIIARDVLHNFYLPHFRVKMDAVPGIPTYFIFTPTKTTDDYRQELRKYPEYNIPSDPSDPNSPPKWKAFEYELACAELCGKGHYSMRRLVKVVTPEEYEKWHATQKSYYLTSVRNNEGDPFKGKPVQAELINLAQELQTNLDKALDTLNKNVEDRTIRLYNLYFETGSTVLTFESELALKVLQETFEKYPNFKVEISGHSDNTGDLNTNMTLSSGRAKSIKEYFSEKGIASDRMTWIGLGPTKPIDTTDTEEGRAKNRRIEFKIIGF
ncbi:MAG: OmpA family protein [Bacteroidota bacterium]|nr:OmpA family protein [Bacteroidota bacterium]